MLRTKTGADWYTAELPATEVPAREKYQVYVDAKMTTPRMDAHFMYLLYIHINVCVCVFGEKAKVVIVAAVTMMVAGLSRGRRWKRAGRRRKRFSPQHNHGQHNTR